MATKLPIQINNLRFSVNPTSLHITKNVIYGTQQTQQGIKFQVWYDAPETLTLSGASAGSTAFQELTFLKQNFEKTNKVCELFYKTRVYQGFITTLEVDHATEHVNFFNYTITFQLLFGQKFAPEDFALTSENRGVVGTALSNLSDVVNAPLNRLNSSLSRLLNQV